MSWSIEIAGKRDDVKAMIESRTDIPECVRTEIVARVASLTLDPANVWPPAGEVLVYLKSFGHFDGSLGGSSTLEIRRIASKPSAAPAG